MSKPVNGYLAEDGSFFDNNAECDRYEYSKSLEKLCDTHELNYENVMAMLNAWHHQIKGYYDADDRCAIKQTRQDDSTDFEPNFNSYDDELPLLRTDGDIPDIASGDKDTPGFLEQQIRGHK